MCISNLVEDAWTRPVPAPRPVVRTVSRPERRTKIIPRPGSSRAYTLAVRQQPLAARCCGFGEGDRRAVDPPPIVQLVVTDPGASRRELELVLKHAGLMMLCSIWDEDGRADMSAMAGEARQPHRLMGSWVSSPVVCPDENGETGCFFPFPDLSVRTVGVYRLKFLVAMIEREPGNVPILAEVYSEPFTVYSAKDFPGMRESTPLVRRLKAQGCLISLKRGSESRQNGGRRRADSGTDEDEDEDGSSNDDREFTTVSGGRKRARRT